MPEDGKKTEETVQKVEGIPTDPMASMSLSQYFERMNVNKNKSQMMEEEDCNQTFNQIEM